MNSYRAKALRKAWSASGMPRLKRQFRPMIKQLVCTDCTYDSWYGSSKSTLIEGLFCITGVSVFAAYYDNPHRFRDNFITQRCSRLFGVNPKLRWRLIHALYKHHWRKALKHLFPQIHPQVINDLTDLDQFLEKYQTKLHWQEPGSVRDHQAWQRERRVLAGVLGLTKAQWLNYARRWGDQSRQLHIYASELSRARELGLDVAEWLALGRLPDPPEARRRHDLVVAQIARHQEWLHKTGHAVRHEENWANLSVPSNWRPLILRQDFTDEGEQMHHCVGSYAYKTESLFAHISLGAEEATLEWVWGSRGSFGAPQIIQLYGSCNQTVSPQMYEHVRDVLAKFANATKAAKPYSSSAGMPV